MSNWYESEVEVMEQGVDEILISDGENEVWIPYEHIGEDSEINSESSDGDLGVIQIKDWFAEECGLIEAF